MSFLDTRLNNYSAHAAMPAAWPATVNVTDHWSRLLPRCRFALLPAYAPCMSRVCKHRLRPPVLPPYAHGARAVLQEC